MRILLAVPRPGSALGAMTASHIGEWAALTTAFCWTITALSFESAGRRVGSLAVNLIRLLIASVWLAIMGYVRRGMIWPTDATPEAWGWLALSGLIGFCIGDLCLFRAFVLIGARLSMLMMALVPPIAAITGWLFLSEHMTLLDISGIALTVAGVAWVILEKRPTSPPDPHGHRKLGILLGFGAAAGQAIGLVMSKQGMGNYDAFAATQIRVLAGAAGFALVFIPIGWWPRVIAACRHRAAMARITLGATFGPFLGVSFSLLAVQNTTTGVAGAIMSIVPILIIVPSMLLFKERISPRAMVGACLAVAGVVVLFIS